MILVDSDVMIDILRQYKPALDWLKMLNNEEIGIPGLVAMELIQGCRNRATFNTKHYRIIKNLQIIQPYQRIE